MHKQISKVLAIMLLALFISFETFAQRTAVYDWPDEWYQSGLELFNKEMYGAAKRKFEKTILYIDDPKNEMRISAEYYNAICSVELFNNDAEIVLRKFIEDHPESSYIRNIYFQLAKFEYRKKEYRDASKSFEKVDVKELSKEEQYEYYFMSGYSFFSTERLEDAKKAFFQIKNIDNKYKDYATYYYSHISYVDGNYETALEGFTAIKDNPDFKPLIPYYVTHIYYMQGKYGELIKIGSELLEKSTPKRQPEIARLIGEAYYRTEKYAESLPYLKRYKESVGDSDPQIQYQLGFANFMVGNYKESVDYFKHITPGNDTISQNANYHMAMAYVKIGNKNFALTAFENAYKIDINKDITENALYNFAKLSYELDYNPYNSAILAFQKYMNDYPKSDKLEEMKEYMAKMYLSTKNYGMAKESIEKLKNRSAEMNQAYHRIVYSLGVEAYKSGDMQKAKKYFEDATKMKYDRKAMPMSIYWLGQTYYQNQEYSKAIDEFKKYQTSVGAINTEVFNRVNYDLAYCNFYLKDYAEAGVLYRVYLRNETNSNTQTVNDAYLRLADCFFMRKEYDNAIMYYTEAEKIGLVGTEYAILKRAEAYGPLGRWQEKVAAYTKLLNNYPKSTYAPAAEYDLAYTYFNILEENQKAISHLKHIIDNNPKQSVSVKKSMVLLGQVYSNIGDDERAIATWKDVNEYYKGSEESKEALKTMRETYIEQGKADEFFAYLKTLGIQAPSSEQDEAIYTQAVKPYFSGDCDKSSQGLVEYLNRFPAGAYVPNAHFYLADCEFRASLFDKALEDYKQVVTMPVTIFTEKSYKQLAYIYFEKKEDYNKALEAYTKLLEIAEDNENINEARLGIMRCQWNLKNMDKIVENCDKVLKIEKLATAEKEEALMYKAKAYIYFNKDSLAMDAFNQIIKLSNSEASAEARYNNALIMYNRGNYDKAESMVYDVIQQDPSYEYWVVKAFILSADIFTRTDNKHQAIATLQSIVQNYKDDQGLINEAKAKLKVLEDEQNAPKTQKKQQEEIILDLPGDKDLELFKMEETVEIPE